MKVLIITKHYLDQKLGGPNCSKAFVKAISAIYNDCTLIYPEHNDHKTDMSFLINKNIKLVPCYDSRSKFRKLTDVYLGRIHRFGGFVEDILSNNVFDIVFIDHSFTASSGVLDAVVKAKSMIVTLHHNVEKDYIKDNQQNILFRYPYNHYALKAEHEAILKSDLNLTLTYSDNDNFTCKYKDKAGTFEVMGMFEYENRDNVVLPQMSVPQDNVFVISGALNARQTESAVMSFINNYLPVLDKVCPQNKVIITGRNPSSGIVAACVKHGNVTIVPNPDDILSVINEGKYYICPLHTGSGLKLRIMDGLRLGIPVLAHDVSCRGYEAIVKDGFMFGYSDVRSFEKGVRELMSASLSREQVSESFTSHFSYKAGECKLASILKKHRLLY